MYLMLPFLLNNYVTMEYLQIGYLEYNVAPFPCAPLPKFIGIMLMIVTVCNICFFAPFISLQSLTAWHSDLYHSVTVEVINTLFLR